MVKIKNRHRLKSKDIKKLKNELQSIFQIDFFDDNPVVETGEYEGVKTIFVDQEPCFILHEGQTFFTLQGINKYRPDSNYVTVDMGAVRFVTNGADVMAPGIVDADEDILENDQVWIRDVNNKKPLAVGFALMSGEQMVNENKGRAIKIVHHVGDKIWIFLAKSL